MLKRYRFWKDYSHDTLLLLHQPEWALESRMTQAALRHFGHVSVCGEIGTGKGEWCDARGNEWEEEVRKTKNRWHDTLKDSLLTL